MKWRSEAQAGEMSFANLPVSVGKAGTTDSVLIISVIAWIARRLAQRS